MLLGNYNLTYSKTQRHKVLTVTAVIQFTHEQGEAVSLGKYGMRRLVSIGIYTWYMLAYTRGKKISVKTKVMEGRTRKKEGNKMRMKAP